MTLCTTYSPLTHLGMLTGSSTQICDTNLNKTNTDTDSGFLSGATSLEGLVRKNTNSKNIQNSSFQSNDENENRQSQRRSSSGQKIVKFFNSLKPYHNRVARRSRSFGDLNRNLKSHDMFTWKFTNSSNNSNNNNNNRTPIISNPLIPCKTTLSINCRNDQSNDFLHKYNPIGNILSNSTSTSTYSMKSSSSSSLSSSITSSTSLITNNLSTTQDNNNNNNDNNNNQRNNNTQSYSSQLDILIIEPQKEMYEFRRLWPSSFLALITNYLGFIVFTSEEIEQIKEGLMKESKQDNFNQSICTTNTPTSTSNTTINNEESISSNGTKIHYTPRKMLNRLREQKQNGNELDHWYTVVNAILCYMLTNNHYKHRFIFRRPGNQSVVNDLEKALFTSYQCPKSNHNNNNSNMNSFKTEIQTNEYLYMNELEYEKIQLILMKYDSSVIAQLLARVLRRHGVGLLPIYLRRLFIQLVSGVKENELHQRRAIRLLFQLCPLRLLNHIIKPLFELMANVVNEPVCEVDETSLAILFSPIFFLDRSTTTPIALANPLPVHVMKIFIRLAKYELNINMSVKKLFQIPILFQHDCNRNLNTHQIMNSPPLSCSLKYCVTMTPSPRSQGKKPTECSQNKSNMPRVNLTAAFIAKRPRAKSPHNLKETITPIMKCALHCPTIDFRVRRTPTHNLRSQCTNTIPRSPVSLIYNNDSMNNWSPS